MIRSSNAAQSMSKRWPRQC